MSKSKKIIKNSIISSVYDTFIGSESALKRYVGRFVHKPEDIDDMVQETFLRAYTATNSREIEYPKAYLFKVAKSVALRALNKKAHQVTDYLEEAQAEASLDHASLEEEIEADQKVQLYCAAIAELPPQCRRVFLMRKYQALSHKEIAEALGITVGAVEKQVTLGIKRCMAYMDKRERLPDGVSAMSKQQGGE